jgi:hypothetical protein
MARTIVARWESKTSKHWVEVYYDTDITYKGHGYTAPGACGWFGDVSAREAIVEIEGRLANFQPDSNKTPMKRTV